MPSAAAGSGAKQQEKMKQKSLMAFFNKSSAPAASTISAKVKPQDGGKAAKEPSSSSGSKSRSNDAPSSDTPDVHTPSKGISHLSVVESPHGTHSSNVPSSPMETPPTSDPVDVDMLSDEEETSRTKSDATSTVRLAS